MELRAWVCQPRRPRKKHRPWDSRAARNRRAGGVRQDPSRPGLGRPGGLRHHHRRQRRDRCQLAVAHRREHAPRSALRGFSGRVPGRGALLPFPGICPPGASLRSFRPAGRAVARSPLGRAPQVRLPGGPSLVQLLERSHRLGPGRLGRLRGQPRPLPGQPAGLSRLHRRARALLPLRRAVHRDRNRRRPARGRARHHRNRSLGVPPALDPALCRRHLPPLSPPGLFTGRCRAT